MELDLLIASQFGFEADRSTTLQCMKRADRFTLNFNTNISTAVVLLYIEKSFDTTLYSVLLHELSSEFPTGLIKLIVSFLIDRKFKVLVESEFSVPREMAARVPQGSILAPVLYIVYTKYTPRTSPNSYCTVRGL